MGSPASAAALDTTAGDADVRPHRVPLLAVGAEDGVLGDEEVHVAEVHRLADQRPLGVHVRVEVSTMRFEPDMLCVFLYLVLTRPEPIYVVVLILVSTYRNENY